LEPGGKVSAQYASLPPNKAMHLTALRAQVIARALYGAILVPR
jgi:hypothetical protein